MPQKREEQAFKSEHIIKEIFVVWISELNISDANLLKITIQKNVRLQIRKMQDPVYLVALGGVLHI